MAEHLAGNTGAFDELFRRFFDRLVAYCRRVGGEADSQDITQETLIRARAKLAEFHTSRPMWPWLKAIATNLVADRARRRGREVPLAPGAEETPVDGGEEGIEERAVLGKAMRGLSAPQRTALRLRYLEDWDTSRAAGFLGLSVPAFKQLVYRAREHLRTEYRRLTDGALGWVLVPYRAVRRWVQVHVAKAQRGGAKAAPYVGYAADSGYQLAAGILAVALGLGGLPPPGTPDLPQPPIVSLEVARPLAAPPPPPGDSGQERPPSDPPSQPPSPPSSSSGVPGPGKKTQGEKKPEETVRDVIDDVTDPNRDTQRPEDARILSVAFSPRFRPDLTVYAAGIAPCESRLCPSVLFQSTDGGATWAREPAVGLVADALLLPPAHAQGDNRIFAMGAEGLQVSEDGGQSFHAATLAGGPHAAGSAAMSPGFNAEDPSILIGGKTLMRYRDDLKTLEPAPNTASPGALEPAYSPAYRSDRTTFLGAIRLDPAWGTTVATVYRCVEAVCTPASLEGQELIPKIRVAPDFAVSAKVYAFTEGAVFVSQDGGEVFSPLQAGWTDEVLWDLLVDQVGRLLAATIAKGPEGHAGLYLSADGGRTWSAAQSELFARGTFSVAASAGRIIVGLGERGVACSSDGGATWGQRCAPA